MPISSPDSGTALVLVVDPALVGAEMTASLSAAERKQAERFRFEKDAIHWRACRAALRGALGEALGIPPATVAFEFGEFGKPALSPEWQGLHFNLSHCRDLALIALCRDGAVGVDVEPADRAASLLGCEDAFCHPEEIAALPSEEVPRAFTLMDIWTKKEALLKALGTGFSVAAPSVSVAQPPASYSGDPRFRDLRLHRLTGPLLQQHLACLAAPAAVSRLEIQQWPG
ncbi:4'-phosphopantetheinyl transferase superfamily protein [Luteolibacter arcticus]|uniref:4'-phosphopantetheinyl transferase superfamily protein n=1 Tax=Luteolibacter arcticus TaxID=1581411 RepID=A0ABT3GT24_9BACT|nr:4'-phosphopantetheinyl transferase superfamily protein [Luteolibacter arcticus]MCW1926668.1 4'-phosphopantetheinyl transferase superfamily protein [Luteolibacter arcticus]